MRESIHQLGRRYVLVKGGHLPSRSKVVDILYDGTLQAIAVPLPKRPIFPGFYVPVSIKDKKFADKLAELKSAGTPWVGFFLIKDQKPIYNRWLTGIDRS